MNAIGHEGLADRGRVILAHEPPFSLGALTVQPATRQVTAGALHETLEPRVMQVLVTLFRARGLVTREELIDRCWDGRVVGQDAINRVLSRIRHIAAGIGSDSFTVETITKVGYRLIENGTGPVESSDSNPAASPMLGRRRMIGGIAAIGSLGAAGAIGAWRWTKRPENRPPAATALYGRALAVRYAGGAANNRQAIAHLREAVRIAPDYGEAWGALALAYYSALLNESPERVVGLEERFQEAVREANRLDPGNSDAAAAMLPRTRDFGHWAEREAIYRRFIDRHAGHGSGYHKLGTLLMDVGRWSDAAEALRAAKARNGFDPIIRYRLTLSLWGAGRISAAEKEIDEAIQRWPQHGAIWQTKIKLLALTGQPAAALDLVKDVTGRPLDEPESFVRDRTLFLTALATRAPDDIEKSVVVMTDRARSVANDRLGMAVQCAMLGRQQLALAMLEGVYLNRGDWALAPSEPPILQTHPLFQPHARTLWPEPRFKQILVAIGLEQYWRSTRTIPNHRRAPRP